MLNAFNSLFSRSNGITLKRPSYNRSPMTLQSGSTIPMIPVSEGLPIRSWNIFSINKSTYVNFFHHYSGLSKISRTLLISFKKWNAAHLNFTSKQLHFLNSRLLNKWFAIPVTQSHWVTQFLTTQNRTLILIQICKNRKNKKCRRVQET